MKYGSICSGIESASVAWGPLGFKCQFMSEIDKFPRAVLQHRFPEVPLHGDFTTIQRGDYGAVDILVGGTPCQSFSVAGLRAGLDDPRGNLMLGFGALAQRLTPQWLVWENVPGVLSSNGGRDFGTFLGMLAQLGFGVCFRILDSQFVRVESHPRAVPQRRRRVFVVGYFGDWRPAAAVLFERESLQGYPPPGRKAGQRTTDSLTVGANQCSGRPGDFVEACAGSLSAQHKVDRGDSEHCSFLVASPLMNGSGNAAGHNARSGHCKDSHIVPVVSPAMKARDSKGVSSDGDGDGLPLVIQDVRSGVETKNQNGKGFSDENVAYTLDAQATMGVMAFQSKASSHQSMNPAPISPCLEVGKSDGVAIAFAQNQRNEVREMDVAGAIPAIRRGDAKNETLCFQEAQTGCREYETAGCIRANGPGHDPVGSRLRQGMMVRRLTPRECERLQGFPDDWTLIPWRGKAADQCPDGPRYKALGNAMACNVMRWIGERIKMVNGRVK